MTAKPPSVINVDRIIAVLREMAHTLEANGHPQAAYVSALATIGEWDGTAMVPGLKSGAMWGSSGSVWEAGEFRSSEEKRRYWSQIVQLVEEMRRAGIEDGGGEWVAATLRKRLDAAL